MRSADLDVSIGAYRFTGAEAVEVTSSWDMLTDVAVMTTPRKLSFRGQAIAAGESLFRRGDDISIRMGYDGQLTERFSGYLARIAPGSPLMRFRAEDHMYLFKSQPVTGSHRSISLSALLAMISPIPYQAADIELGRVKYNKATPAAILDMLRKDYGIYSWCRGGRLYSGLAYWAPSASHSFAFRYNIIRDQLEYQRAEDLRVAVTAVSIRPDNTKTEITVGDQGGDSRTVYYYDLGESDLRQAAERDLDRIRFTGFRGSFETFGSPRVQHGDIVNLRDDDYPDRNGAYLVKKVETRYGAGIRQVITLDTQA